MRRFCRTLILCATLFLFSCKVGGDSKEPNREFSARSLTWEQLSKISFENKLVDSLQQTIPFPIFNDTLRSMEATLVQLSGFIIPIEEIGENDLLVLSANPYASCFFCGKAGVESVVEIHLKDQNNKAYQMDRRISFTGKLKLNNTDPNYLPYILEEAVEVAEK